MIRFLREYLNPKSKCERLGHDLYIRYAIIRRAKGGNQNDFVCQLHVCNRCLEICSEPLNEQEIPIQPFQCDKNNVKDMKDKGYTIIAKTI